jgi:hypothetical protein
MRLSPCNRHEMLRRNKLANLMQTRKTTDREDFTR